MIQEEILEDVSTAVMKIMKQKGVTDYKYEIEGQSEAGDNYMGEVIFLSVTPEDDEKEVYHLVMKTAKRSPQLRENMSVDIFYGRELYMYSDVFPTYNTFIKEIRPDFDFDILPKVYYYDKTQGKESLVMENLKSEGYKLRDRKIPWNLEHSLFAMEEYGKLHAISMALKDQKPSVYEELKKNLDNVMHTWNDKVDYKQFLAESVEHVMGLLKNAGRDDLVAKYDGLLDEAIENVFLKDTVEKDKLAICHMDCWNNNFMFKYENEDETKPKRLRLLDFQLSCIDSPAKDLSYNIYATCDNSCLEHFDLLLQTYHESLRRSLMELGTDQSKCFSMAELRRHWRKYGLHGLFFSITLIKIELLDKDDAPKIEDMAEYDNLLDGFHVKVTDQKEYDRRISEVFMHFGNNFL